MASHGIPRIATREEKSEEAHAREAREIRRYQELVAAVESEVRNGDFTPELLQKTAEVLKTNPEFYTVWNHRKRIYNNEFKSILDKYSQGDLTAETRDSEILDIIRLDLQFLLPLLIQFPKCYWIWNHRIWLLDQATTLLPAAKARPVWEEELRLASRMLSRDNRNFHGWGYRRTIVDNLESNALNGTSMAIDELDYTTRMVKTNLSNFSAWHNRTRLISKVLDEKGADENGRRQMLDNGGYGLDPVNGLYRLTLAEIALIHDALFDPYDQSLWFYHQNLLCTFDPDRASQTFAPLLSDSVRLDYLSKEVGFIKELLDDFSDCKWIYQALIDCKLLASKIQGFMSEPDQGEVKAWLIELKSLDQLRGGRWVDLEKKLGV